MRFLASYLVVGALFGLAAVRALVEADDWGFLEEGSARERRGKRALASVICLSLVAFWPLVALIALYVGPKSDDSDDEE